MPRIWFSLFLQDAKAAIRLVRDSVGDRAKSVPFSLACDRTLAQPSPRPLISSSAMTVFHPLLKIFVTKYKALLNCLVEGCKGRFQKKKPLNP